MAQAAREHREVRIASGRLGVAMRWVPAALLLLLLPRLYLFAYAAFKRLVEWPWQLDFVEGVNLNATLQLAAGHNIYRHNGPQEFISAPYPPVFYILTAPVSWFTGTSLVPGRVLSLLATIVASVAIAYVVWKLTGGRAAGLFAGALWLSLSPVIAWSGFSKQDILALAFGAAGLAWALSRIDGPQVYIATVLFSLAFYSKQSTLAAAAATTMWLLFRDPKLGLRFGALLAALVLGPFILGNAILRGGLSEHIIGNHGVPYRVEQTLNFLRHTVIEYWPLLVLSGGVLVTLAVYAARHLRGRRLRGLIEVLRNPYSLITAYFLLGWVTTLSTMGIEGANYNHLLDGMLPTCMLLGLATGVLASRSVASLAPGNSRWSQAGLGLLALLMLAQAFTMRDPYYMHPGTSGGLWGDAMQPLSDLVARTPGEIYSSDDAYLALSNGRRVLFDDPSTFVPLAEAGAWDDSEFIQWFRDRGFALVLIRRNIGPGVRWSEKQYAAFRDNYRLALDATIQAWEPKRYGTTPQRPLDCTFSGDGNKVSLLGVSFGPGATRQGVRRGDTLFVTRYWRPDVAVNGDYATYIHMLDAGGSKVAGQDLPQTGATSPTSAWEPGKAIIDEGALPIGVSLAPGRYRVIGGMYSVQDSAIRPLTPSCGSAELFGEAVVLGDIEVK